MSSQFSVCPIVQRGKEDGCCNQMKHYISQRCFSEGMQVYLLYVTQRRPWIFCKHRHIYFQVLESPFSKCLFLCYVLGGSKLWKQLLFCIYRELWVSLLEISMWGESWLDFHHACRDAENESFFKQHLFWQIWPKRAFESVLQSDSSMSSQGCST